MYIPAHFRQKDNEIAITFMRRYPFAAIVSVKDGLPLATHLPFHIAVDDGHITLSAHFAKANPQWNGLDEAMVIFSGPHAYISPALYNKEESVPTWNYIAVHAWGNVHIEEDETRGYAMLEELIEQSEPSYKAQWTGLSADYKHKLYKGIVPFTLSVQRLEAKEKLSQNKAADAQTRIAAFLSESSDGATKDTGSYMQERQNME